MSNNEPSQNQQIQIRVKDNELKGSYANALQISHSQEEFFLDFLLIYGITGQLVKRIIVSPRNAKRIMSALQDNLAKYESRFGPIQKSDAGSTNFGFNVQK